MNDFLREAPAFPKLGGAFADLLVERLERRVMVVQRRHLLGGHDDRGEVALRRRILEGGGALFTLKQELNATEAALNLPDARDDAHRVENVRRRLIRVVALGDRENQT